MLFGNDRHQIRRFFFEVWRKQQLREPLEPLQRLIADVIALHPEYHSLLADPDKAMDKEFPVEEGATNPFLHMGMHIALQEQLLNDRPEGILSVYQTLCRRLGDSHAVEHRMMECLGEMLWEAQRAGSAPDEQVYLQKLRRLQQRI